MIVNIITVHKHRDYQLKYLIVKNIFTINRQNEFN